MQIKQDITHLLLLVEGEFEADVDSLGSEPLTVAFVGLKDVWVIDEPGRPDEHECQLFANAVMGVVFEFEVGGLLVLLGLVRRHLGLLSNFLQAHFHIFIMVITITHRCS